jgi:pimeloyl-ACP methyl ester carboxylesterase
MSIEPAFIDRGSKKLFVVFFPPRGEGMKLPFVLCNAFGSETEIFRVHFVHFARKLAERGHPVLRFDYLGYGDSEGEFAEATPSTMEADIEAAIDEVVRRTGAKEVGLVGLRLGATLAARVAARRTEVTHLALWEPQPKPWDDLYAELRSTVSMQTVLFKDVKKTRDEILAGVLAETPTMVDGYDLNVIDDGYPLSKRLVEEAKEIDLLKSPPKTSAKTLVLHVRRNPGQPGKKLADFIQALQAAGVSLHTDVAVESTLPWLHEQIYTTHSANIYDKTFAWLDGAGKGA